MKNGLGFQETKLIGFRKLIMKNARDVWLALINVPTEFIRKKTESQKLLIPKIASLAARVVMKFALKKPLVIRQKNIWKN